MPSKQKSLFAEVISLGVLAADLHIADKALSFAEKEIVDMDVSPKIKRVLHSLIAHLVGYRLTKGTDEEQADEHLRQHNRLREELIDNRGLIEETINSLSRGVRDRIEMER